MTIDSHCHASLAWYEPVEALLQEMERNDVAAAVLIQIMGQYDQTYQFACVRRYPGRFASVVLVDTDRADALGTLERLAEQGASGVRLTAATRSPGADPLAIWRAAERLELPISCAGPAAVLASDDFRELVSTVPHGTIVIEHLGGLTHRHLTPEHGDLAKRVFALARHPNVCMKLPGFGEFAVRRMPVTEPFPFVTPVPPLLHMAVEAFGPSRLMWGSDFPPVSGREGYRQALRLPMEVLAALTADEREALFGGVARRVFFSRS